MNKLTTYRLVNPLSANPRKQSNTLLLTNSLSVFEHFGDPT